ncbi:hypothetical protein OAK51_02630 [Alphaproteobacteria bacterium]|nr:hypothetical protein [Alphaproteobacteria bacterium]
MPFIKKYENIPCLAYSSGLLVWSPAAAENTVKWLGYRHKMLDIVKQKYLRPTPSKSCIVDVLYSPLLKWQKICRMFPELTFNTFNVGRGDTI